MSRSRLTGRLSAQVVVWAPLMVLAAMPAAAQVFVVEPEHVEKHYAEFPPTHVPISNEPMTTLTREELIRFMEREQGFAMRPLPIAVLTLRANGGMEPAGDKYISLLQAKGVSAKPGERVVVTDIKIDKDTIVLDLNGGPFHKHRFMRHVSIDMGVAEAPLGQDNGPQPTGTRLTVRFGEPVPDLTGEQLEALLKPMIDFGVKSPAEAYAETLPDFLRDAIKQHRVLVGMNRDMVNYAKGMPIRKVREMDAQGRQFEIWIYGEAPQPVEFVRFMGRYVVRVEVAKVGEPVLVRTANEMGDYWGNQPVVATNQHEIQLGDQTQQERSVESAPRAAPTLRQPGDPAPTDDKKNPQPVMAPVNFPKDQQRPGDPGYTPTVSAQPQAQPTSGQQSSGQPKSGQQNNGQPTSGQPSSGQQQPTSGQQNSGQPKSGQQNNGQPTSGQQQNSPPAAQPQF
ncbi:MAG: hypothetical protein WB622_15750 [Acidobacteriaceae bacterium]|jgi:hypothetical protein